MRAFGLAQQVLLILSCFAVATVRGADSSAGCDTGDLASLEAQFAKSPLVIRAKFKEADAIDLPCPLPLDSEQTSSKAPSFLVQEILKNTLSTGDITGAPLQVGSIVPIVQKIGEVFSTNSPFASESLGFLAFLEPARVCVDGSSYPDAEPVTPYQFNFCVAVNQPWRQVSQEDKAVLDGLAGKSGTSGGVSNKNGLGGKSFWSTLISTMAVTIFAAPV